MDQKTIIFIFAGRKLYLEILKKYLIAIVKSHSNIEIHLWNFCRNSSDNEYIRNLATSLPNTKIFNQYYEGGNTNSICKKSPGVICTCTKCRVGLWTEPYKYYASNPDYQKCIFFKIDDDILYLDINKFNSFITQAASQPNKIFSANVINNGVCAMFTPAISRIVIDRGLLANHSKYKNFISSTLRSAIIRIKGKKYKSKKWWGLCTNVDFLKISHAYFLNNISALLSLPNKIIPLPQSRFSINAISFSSAVMNSIAVKIGNELSMNDEEIISNNFPILIVFDFLACHLHFADQRARLLDQEEKALLNNYDSLADDITKIYDISH